jgi:hypothetical protein
MKRVPSCMFAALACAAVVTVSAQTPPSEPQTPATAKQGPSSMDAQNKVTVTGCLERAKESASPTGTSGAAAAGDTAKFMLNNVTASPSASATAGTSASGTSASGTAGTSGSARATASSYRLDAEDAKLTAHVGHKVTISGTVENRASATGATMSASAPKLKVDTVTHVSPTCTP